MVLATITASLANFLKISESDLNLTDIMGEGDEQHNVEDDKAAATGSVGEMSGISTPSTAGDKRIPLPTASFSRSQPKKNLPESWEDEDLEDSSSEAESDYMWGDSSESEDEKGGNGERDRSVEELELGFKNIHIAFSKLRVAFDTKFRVIFA